ncbi:superoxide dismutase family protein [Agriterribacter sp.]|uniref:superoxide dismutase family protein n=1 Tax=Agriterribacter sp. TaxID=2821509 RepID=UPI002BF22A9B|nr:superoxide dismutase family protein [Agriterribacter sp.]HRP58251.1 superoxide dismutase family protein [Agriterribacter sp.]
MLALLPAVALVFSCNNPSDTAETTVDSTNVMDPATDAAAVPLVNHAEAVLTGTYADTTVSGTAKFDADDNGKVKMELEITIPAKAGKSVAVHIHEHGDCGDNGNMSHGHWNPTNKQHGKWGSADFHSGDIGNVQLDNQGKGTLTLETDLWTLGGGPEKNILDKALIVHGGTDDYTSQPSGNAGTRIGCGVIK